MMTAEEETRRVVEGYFAAWTSNKVDEAYALLADDLAFWGPTAATRAPRRSGRRSPPLRP
jgi:ketosteroid isomerase-like protein